MLNYYKEGLETSKKQLELAKLGYKQVLEELGKSLAEAKSVEESELIIDKIRASRKAISELEGTVAHNHFRIVRKKNIIPGAFYAVPPGEKVSVVTDFLIYNPKMELST